MKKYFSLNYSFPYFYHIQTGRKIIIISYQTSYFIFFTSNFHQAEGNILNNEASHSTKLAHSGVGAKASLANRLSIITTCTLATMNWYSDAQVQNLINHYACSGSQSPVKHASTTTNLLDNTTMFSKTLWVVQNGKILLHTVIVCMKFLLYFI